MPIASATFAALGSTAVVAVDEPGSLETARGVAAGQIDSIDRACSRFRSASELARLNRAEGTPVTVNELLFEAIAVAVWAARASEGLVDDDRPHLAPGGL